MVRSYGTTLIELMVALTIGSLVMIGALDVFGRIRTTFRINESVARLQENARFAFDLIEPEIRMAGYYGFAASPAAIEGRARGEAPLSGAVAGDCDIGWAIDLDRPVAASNAGYDWPGCQPGPAGASPAPAADTLVVRRAAARTTAAPVPNTLYLHASLDGTAVLFEGVAPPPGSDTPTETRELAIAGFYVSGNSTLGTPGQPVPSLRRKRLRHGNAGDPRIVDEEVLPAIEDLQVRFGVDTDSIGEPGRGSVDRYVDPDDGLLDPAHAAFDPDAAILTVRIRLGLRAEQRETGLPGDGFRRLVVSRTIAIRNARTSR